MKPHELVGAVGALREPTQVDDVVMGLLHGCHGPAPRRSRRLRHELPVVACAVQYIIALVQRLRRIRSHTSPVATPTNLWLFKDPRTQPGISIEASSFVLAVEARHNTNANWHTNPIAHNITHMQKGFSCSTWI